MSVTDVRGRRTRSITNVNMKIELVASRRGCRPRDGFLQRPRRKLRSWTLGPRLFVFQLPRTSG
jgi:hypothetical protein